MWVGSESRIRFARSEHGNSQAPRRRALEAARKSAEPARATRNRLGSAPDVARENVLLDIASGVEPDRRARMRLRAHVGAREHVRAANYRDITSINRGLSSNNRALSLGNNPFNHDNFAFKNDVLTLGARRNVRGEGIETPRHRGTKGSEPGPASRPARGDRLGPMRERAADPSRFG
jgi:hypothetical protein